MATPLWDDFYEKLSSYARNLNLNDFNYSSNVSLKHKYLYIEIAKAGCSSIKLTLQRLELEDPQFSREVFAHIHNRAYSPLLRLQNVPNIDKVMKEDDYFRFTFVRNPYTRLLSSYLDKIKGNAKYEKETILGVLGHDMKDLGRDISFAEFIEAISKQSLLDMNPHWRPQFYSLCKNHIHYDFIGHFESFNDDLKYVGQQISPAFNEYIGTEQRHATSAASQLSDYYTDEIIDLVYQLYKKDFIEFGYSKNIKTLESATFKSNHQRTPPSSKSYFDRSTLALASPQEQTDTSPPQKRITIIIPFRYSPHLYEALPRIEKILDTIPRSLMDVLLVDYGSKAEDVIKYDFIHDYPNAKVHRVELEENTPFSIGAARDIGAQHAENPIILFHDVDFLCSQSMYEKIYNEALARDIFTSRASDFFCVPIAFLNQQGSNHFAKLFETENDLTFDSKFNHVMLTSGGQYTEFLVYGSSAITVNRYHYLRIGGHSKSFFGHGAEDYDLLHRLSRFYQKGPKTANYYTDTKSNAVNKYKGFRAFFALYGLDVFMKGICMMHLWHPTRAMPDYFQSKRNFTILQQLMRDFDQSGIQPPALPDQKLKKSTLILAEASSAFGRTIRDALPAMGEVEFLDESFFSDSSSLLSFIDNNDIDQVGFKNPYGNEHRLALYQAIRASGSSYWVFDRGALPDSWFFDPNGFNFESESYKAPNWDVELSPEQISSIQEYIAAIKKSDTTLEKNGMRLGSEHLKLKLGLNHKKIIFIPFQRPSDSVCRHFAGKMGTTDGFYQLVLDFSAKIAESHPNWIVLGKKHPLEDSMPEFPNVRFVPDSTHIYDLIEASDLICLLNSGVGLLSALFNKPVLYAGQAFYGHPGINHEVSTPGEIISFLDAVPEVDSRLVEKFIYHLKTKVYSFGQTNYRSIIREEDNSRVSLADGMVFSEIRGLSGDEIILGDIPKGIGLDNPLFFSFGGREGIKPKKNTNQTSERSHTPSKTSFRQYKLMTFVYLTYPFIKGSKKEKLRRNPAAFFRDAKGGFTKACGRLIGF